VFVVNPEYFRLNDIYIVLYGDGKWFSRGPLQESVHWRHALSAPPRKFKSQSPAGKIMTAIFWDKKGVLLIDYLPDKTTMNGQYYANLLLKLRQAIKDKRRGMLTHGVWLSHDNSPVHKSTLPSKLFATVALYS